ncbi:MAG: ComF family protein [Candidatus Cloacimonetes bacterium]|nr:ComF family protein [Candidatus Cloacimonadota bacterium]
MRLSATLKATLDCILPPVCLSCHQRLDPAADILCESCREALTPVNEPICPKCGAEAVTKVCDHCFDITYVFDQGRSLFRFDGAIQDLVHKVKYEGYLSPVTWFACHAAEHLKSFSCYDDLDIITATPLHRVRRRERGFNQSELIARKLAELMDLPYHELIRRRSYTLSQTNLSKQEREHNLRDVFVALHPGLIAERHILLVDDVFTTGTTVNEVSKVIKKYQPRRISVLTMARPLG